MVRHDLLDLCFIPHLIMTREISDEDIDELHLLFIGKVECDVHQDEV